VTKKHITHDDFKNVLLESLQMHHEMPVLRSQDHQMYFEKMNKKSMTPFDDKRYILLDGIRTVPHCTSKYQSLLSSLLV
jgi:hypothetical protein